jgi:hypothetical protein
MAAGIIDPTKVFCCFCCSDKFLFFLLAQEKSVLQNQVVRCCLEHAASVAKTFITSDAVVVDIKVPEQAPAANPMGGGGSGKYGTKKVGYLLSNWNELTTCVGFVFRFWILEKFLEMSFHSLPAPWHVTSEEEFHSGVIKVLKRQQICYE